MLNEELGSCRGREGKKEWGMSLRTHCGLIHHIEVLELNFC